ncbi:hypothetical protein [Labrys sp. ZIDIC5]|uniref:hypothetical protein n=1 Tax=Labrys sedimenti TaxID=3106036 RepID=UPI002AC9F772|nr:hypothetical protein [Labrys sp. ZIDIC5]MDZ5451992.1 hypothetical protein [Labrys sp. ZIDIC5]
MTTAILSPLHDRFPRPPRPEGLGARQLLMAVARVLYQARRVCAGASGSGITGRSQRRR